MGDLIIKPTTGSGNKLIIQTEDGTPIVTTSDSGAALSADVSVPAGNLSGTLPALIGSALTGIDAATVSTTAPSSPAVGDMWFDSTVGVTAMKVYNGTSWDTMSTQTQDGSTAALAPEYGSDIIALGKPAGLYYLTGATTANHTAQQVYVDSSGWMLFHRHAGTGGSYNSTYEITGDALLENAVGVLSSPNQGLTDFGSSTTAGSRGVARLATNFVRSLGGDNATTNTYRFTVGGTTVYITDAQWWATAPTSDSYGATSISWGTSYAGRRNGTGTPEAARPMGTYPLGSYTIPYYHGLNYSGGYDGTWHVASTLWVREY